MAKSKASSNSSGSLLDQYIERYFACRPDPVDHEDFINEQMRAFDEREKNRLEELERMANVPDEDGFVTAVSKRPAIVGEDEDDAPVTKKKSKELPNFYKFQAAQQGRNMLEDLRGKFEEDKRRLDDLKKSKLLQ